MNHCYMYINIYFLKCGVRLKIVNLNFTIYFLNYSYSSFWFFLIFASSSLLCLFFLYSQCFSWFSWIHPPQLIFIPRLKLLFYPIFIIHLFSDSVLICSAGFSIFLLTLNTSFSIKLYSFSSSFTCGCYAIISVLQFNLSLKSNNSPIAFRFSILPSCCFLRSKNFLYSSWKLSHKIKTSLNTNLCHFYYEYTRWNFFPRRLFFSLRTTHFLFTLSTGCEQLLLSYLSFLLNS